MSPLALSDAELEARCRSRLWERPLRILEIVVSLAGSFALTSFVMSLLPTARCLVLPAFPIVYLVAYHGFLALHAALPLGLCRRELAFRRFRAGLACWAPAGELRAWSRRLLAEAGQSPSAFRDRHDTPAWLIVLQGHGIPQEERVSVRVSLSRDGAGSSVLVQRPAHGSDALAEADLPDRSIPWPLSTVEADELSGLLASFPQGFGGEVEVRGRQLPCRLVVARRDPPEEIELSINPAGMADDAREPSNVLTRHLLMLSRREGA